MFTRNSGTARIVLAVVLVIIGGATVWRAMVERGSRPAASTQVDTETIAAVTGPDIDATMLALPPPNVTAFVAEPTATSAAPPRTAAAPVPSSTAGPDCNLFEENPDLLTPIVNRDIALDKHFEPDDLQTPKLAYRNAYIVSTTVRSVVLQPLYDMLKASNGAGLQLMVVSGYRSYAQQQAAYQKWSELYPDRVDSISALPGHSEHQLGLAIDFSTPYMEGLYHNLFHINFAKTPEGKWLSANAASYGFTLSFPDWGKEQTGYDWEPWHYRYVGPALAKELADRHVSLTQYIRECSARTTP